MDKEEAMGKQMKVMAQYERATRAELKNLAYNEQAKINAAKGGRPQYGETYEEYRKRKGLE
jgi:hypothetical protein